MNSETVPFTAARSGQLSFPLISFVYPSLKTDITEYFMLLVPSELVPCRKIQVYIKKKNGRYRLDNKLQSMIFNRDKTPW